MSSVDVSNVVRFKTHAVFRRSVRFRVRSSVTGCSELTPLSGLQVVGFGFGQCEVSLKLRGCVQVRVRFTHSASEIFQDRVQSR